MTKRRCLILGLLVACLGLTGYLLLQYAMPLAPGITAANFDRLRPGMGAEQAEALLGGPCHEQRPCSPGDFANHIRIWRQGDDVIHVAFTKQGMVCGGTATFQGRSAMVVHHPSLVETLSRMIWR